MRSLTSADAWAIDACLKTLPPIYNKIAGLFAGIKTDIVRDDSYAGRRLLGGDRATSPANSRNY